MQHRIGIVLQLAVFLFTGVLAGPGASPQGNAPPSLQEQLEAQYQLTKKGGNAVVPGTVLVLLKEGTVGAPASNPKSPVVKYSNGALQSPSAAVLAQFGKDTRPIPKGEKVYVTKITVSLIEDWVRLQIVQCGACNAAAPAGSYSSVVGFQFAKGSLKKASVPDIEDTIAQVFYIYTPPAAPPPPPPKPPAPVVTVSETLAKSLQEKISSIGRVSWSMTNTVTTTTGHGKHLKQITNTNTTQAWEEASQVTVNPRTCEMNLVLNPSSTATSQRYFLEEVDTVEVPSLLEFYKRRASSFNPTISPTVYSVVTNGSSYDVLKVRDLQTGNQIAGEMQELAQQCRAIPIPPPAPNSEPSLVDTLHFIENKLNDIGSVQYRRTPSDGSESIFAGVVSYVITQAAADPSSCILRFREGSPAQPVVISLRRVQNLEVAPHQDALSSPQNPYTIDPMVYGLFVTFPGGGRKEILFRDEETANRVAKAMNHAAELCGTFGGGSTIPEPF